MHTSPSHSIHVDRVKGNFSYILIDCDGRGREAQARLTPADYNLEERALVVLQEGTSIWYIEPRGYCGVIGAG
jgi:hypothetical protein